MHEFQANPVGQLNNFISLNQCENSTSQMEIRKTISIETYQCRRFSFCKTMFISNPSSLEERMYLWVWWWGPLSFVLLVCCHISTRPNWHRSTCCCRFLLLTRASLHFLSDQELPKLLFLHETVSDKQNYSRSKCKSTSKSKSKQL